MAAAGGVGGGAGTMAIWGPEEESEAAGVASGAATGAAVLAADRDPEPAITAIGPGGERAPACGPEGAGGAA